MKVERKLSSVKGKDKKTLGTKQGAENYFEVGHQKKNTYRRRKRKGRRGYRK